MSLSRRCLLLPLALFLVSTSSSAAGPGEVHYDVVIYGGTAAGVTASVQAARQGRSVVLIEPGRQVGGLTSAGGAAVPPENAQVLGGLAREFHQRIHRYYQGDAKWLREKRADGAGAAADAKGAKDTAMWTCEPHVAARILEDMLREAGVPVILGGRLKEEDGVRKDGARIKEITLEDGSVWAGRVFVDATCEGDLMAGAGVTLRNGREANGEYGETLNGIQAKMAEGLQIPGKVDARVTAGRAGSGLLDGISKEPPGEDGAADPRLAPPGHVLCVTTDPANRLLWPKPASYDPKDFELAVRLAEVCDAAELFQWTLLPNRKFALRRSFLLDACFLGMDKEHLERDATAREDVRQRLVQRETGLMWTLANDERVPEEVRKRFQEAGLCRDEHVAGRFWPLQADTLGTRRMISDVVMTEKHSRSEEIVPDSVGMSSATIIQHPASAHANKDGMLRIEGGLMLKIAPHAISFRAIRPKAEECTNLLVPVCLSATHVAYGGIRHDPVFMVLGQSAGAAAALAVEEDVDIQALDYDRLRSELLKANQILEDEARRREVVDKIATEKNAADSVMSEIERKTKERARARAEMQEKRRAAAGEKQ